MLAPCILNGGWPMCQDLRVDPRQAHGHVNEGQPMLTKLVAHEGWPSPGLCSVNLGQPLVKIWDAHEGWPAQGPLEDQWGPAACQSMWCKKSLNRCILCRPSHMGMIRANPLGPYRTGTAPVTACRLGNYCSVTISTIFHILRVIFLLTCITTLHVFNGRHFGNLTQWQPQK